MEEYAAVPPHLVRRLKQFESKHEAIRFTVEELPKCESRLTAIVILVQTIISLVEKP